MVKGILADINVQGQVSVLSILLESDVWRGIWTAMGLRLLTFAEVGLAPQTSDAVVWQFCQDQGLVLVTGNRNKDGPDSLEATLQSHNVADSLPVLTLADPEAIRHSRAHAERAEERLLDVLIEIDNYRGTGRLYLP